MTTRTGSPHVPVEADYTEAEYQEAEAENDGIEWSDEDLDGPQGVVAPLNTISPEDVEAGQNAFDQWLRERDAHSGIRHHEDIVALAQQHGLAPEHDHAMPANNRLLVFVRRGADS